MSVGIQSWSCVRTFPVSPHYTVSLVSSSKQCARNIRTRWFIPQGQRQNYNRSWHDRFFTSIGVDCVTLINNRAPANKTLSWWSYAHQSALNCPKLLGNARNYVEITIRQFCCRIRHKYCVYRVNLVHNSVPSDKPYRVGPLRVGQSTRRAKMSHKNDIGHLLPGNFFHPRGDPLVHLKTRETH